jgi:2-polyprenyl-3-methyl-5-hydroxy-6-metoxy-1,4-benzoquinol methylase
MVLLKENIGIDGHVANQRLKLTTDALRKEIDSRKAGGARDRIQVLELGCDDGSFAYGFSKEECSVAAVDISLAGILPENHRHNLVYLQADVTKLNFDSCFDVIHAGEILEHVKSPRKLLNGIIRAAKADALIMISVPSFAHPAHRRTYTHRRFERMLKKYSIYGDIHTLRHKHKESKSEVYACYDGRIRRKR